jgi:hypothetical protein
MSLSYRVVKEKTKVPLGELDISHAIHTVYIDENGDVVNISEKCVFPIADNVDDLKHQLVMMLEACGKPVIDYNTGEEVN